MPREFRPHEPDQGLLPPPSLRDWHVLVAEDRVEGETTVHRAGVPR
jgi:hypothetical protein